MNNFAPAVYQPDPVLVFEYVSVKNFCCWFNFNKRHVQPFWNSEYLQLIMCCSWVCKIIFCFSGVICTAECSRWQVVSVYQGSPGLTLAVRACPAQVGWCLHAVEHLTPASSGSQLTAQCLHTLSCVFSVCSSPPEWYFYSETPRPCRTCFGDVMA